MTRTSDDINVFDWETSFSIFAHFCQLLFNSTILGLAVGFSCSYLLKRVRNLTKNPVSESAMIFCFGYFAYVLAELLGNFSGIISLLTCAIT